ncbi:MAG: TonB C-terminal domain-containing protein [Gemmatimonadaceae bacterium]|nr:TonB C-terminal domain-containing protein [Gemmatimonadaceae bacterium]
MARGATLTGSHPTWLRSGFMGSLAVHVALAGVAWWMAGKTEPPRPPIYRVELMGRAGLRQAGVETPTATPATTGRDVAGAERVPEEKVAPKTTTTKKVVPSPKATPSTDRTRKGGAKSATETSKTTSAPKAGAGATGTKGADVVNLRTDGIEFPFPGYLNNIIRQLSLNWNPRRVSAALITEIKFMIRRDGSVAGIEVVKASGDRLYDLDGMGAIEAVGLSRSFGPLPSGWSDDVLVVYFTFDYALRPQ